MVCPTGQSSNMAYVVVGLLIALACDYQFPKKHWFSTVDETTTSSDDAATVLNARHKKLYGTLFACVVCLMGPGSAALHASLSVEGRFMDLFCMYLISAFTFVYSATRKIQGQRLRCVTFFLLYCLLILVLLPFLMVSSDTSLKRSIFAALIVTTLALELCHGIRSHCLVRKQETVV